MDSCQSLLDLLALDHRYLTICDALQKHEMEPIREVVAAETTSVLRNGGHHDDDSGPQQGDGGQPRVNDAADACWEESRRRFQNVDAVPPAFHCLERHVIVRCARARQQDLCAGMRVTPVLQGGRPGTTARTKAMVQAKAAAAVAAALERQRKRRRWRRQRQRERNGQVRARNAPRPPSPHF